MIRYKVRRAIEEVMEEEKFPKISFDVADPPSDKFGDYSSNVALKLSSLKGNQSPSSIAKEFIPKLKKKIQVSDIDFANPGFINFYLEPKLIQNNTQKIIELGDDFGSIDINKGKRARVEYVSANPTGPLHIGNARGGPIGDSLANVFSATGYKVTREYYDNNIGSQVDSFVDSLQKIISGKAKEGQYTGTYYKELAQRFRDVERDKLKVKVIKKLFSEIIKDLKDMGIEFDEIYHESDLQSSKDTEKIVDFLKSKKLTKERDKATWFAPDDGFIKNKEAVLVRSNGTYTYFADDIAYHKKKFESRADLIVNVLGSNHHGHVPRIYAAIKALGYDSNMYKVIMYQYVRVKKGKDIVKMSKRLGNYITAREVLYEVGKDAFRFFLLMFSPNTHMDFDLGLAKKKSEANPVYYVQYAHARCFNLLKNAEKEGFRYDKSSKADLTLLSEKLELSLAKKIQKLPEVVEDISETLSVHQLTTYVTEVADLLHKYYERYRVIGEEKEIMKARLSLILATKITLSNTLRLIGVSAPEKM